jgi:hypothetical protein
VIRADLIYERMISRRYIPPLQRRLMFLVHARRMKLRLLEVQIACASGVNEHNQKLLSALQERYTDMLFPGIDRKDMSSFEEQAKKLLAEEIKNVYRVTRLTDAAAKEKEMSKILGSGTAGGAVAAQINRQVDQVQRAPVRSRIRKRK